MITLFLKNDVGAKSDGDLSHTGCGTVQDRIEDWVSCASCSRFRKLISLQRFQGDFSLKEASLNQCVLSFDNKLLATCGDDSVLRIYTLAEDFKSVTGKQELKNCGDQPHTSVDLSRDNSLLVAASKDANAYIVDLKT